MIHLLLPLSPSRHNRDADIREALKQAIVEQLGGETPVKRMYHTEIVFRGDYYKPNGEPRERDGDSPVIPLFDALAEAFEFGKRGRGDNWLNHSFCVRVEQDSSETVEVTLT